MMFRLTLLLLLALVPSALAQNVFVAIEGGTPKLVKEVRVRAPMVETGGKLVGSSAHEFALAKSTLYRPGLVTLSDFHVGVHHIQDTQGNRFNYDMRINGRAKSDVAFTNCFLVLELKWGRNRGWLFAEMHDLPADRAVELNYSFPVSDQLDEGSYHLHLFSNGIELLHSKMRADYLAFQKQKTTDLLAGKMRDYPAIAEDMVKPAYPPELKAQKLAGTARVRCTINIRGEVVAPELVEATHPAFGAAALAALPKWKFDPALKERRFVESTVIVPVEFKPPR
jgi:TonB family protein